MKKGNLSTIILILIFLVGLSLLLYPTVSDYVNSRHQSQVIAEYNENVSKLGDDVYRQLWAEARSYNESLLNKANRYEMTDEERTEYEKLLDISGNGIIGYIDIPIIDCTLPVYHGTDEAVLQIAAGHIEGSSLPVGGESTHCVISGHRGLPSAKLFTKLDKLVVGDIFMLHVLDETLTYEVDQLLIVEPDNIDALGIEKGKDYCTLVTCTPYGVNSHRLLVRGHRIGNIEKEGLRVTADAMRIEPLVIAPMVAVPLLLLLLIVLLLRNRRKK